MPRNKHGGEKNAIRIQVGNHRFTYGKDLLDIDDSTDLYLKNDFKSLRYKLEADGYIFVRNLIPKDAAVTARNVMLKQAAKDGSVINTNEIPYTKSRINKKHGKGWKEGYCVDAISGSETNNRQNIDINAWNEIGPSNAMKDVYASDQIRLFWKKLFSDYHNDNEACVQPLTKQTFLRLMGDSGTQEHADYYYFKKHTKIFNGNDGRSAINLLKKYKLKNNLKVQNIDDIDENIMKNLIKIENIDDVSDKNGNLNNNILKCHICDNIYLESSLENKRLQRLKEGGFGVSGYEIDQNNIDESTWHCPSCMIECFGIYTTWISLSNLNLLKSKDSILALCPKSHLLSLWDIPQSNNKQLCSDFEWTMPWVIANNVNIGDIILFNIKTIHASTLNLTRPKIYRVSCDTRIILKDNNNDNTNNK